MAKKEKSHYEQLLEKMKDGSFMKEIQEKQEALGLLDVMAYHCNRCHYLWFPKDFDLGENNLDLEPPKACARCKSKYWNKPPVRKTENVYSDKYGMHHNWNICHV
jgi:rubrerythrin